MKTILHYYYNRITRYLTSGWSLRKVIALAGSMVALVFIPVLILFALVWTGALGTLPGKAELILVENPTSSEVYSSDSVLLGRYFLQERSNLRFDQLPRPAIDALLATEDIRFYNHGAIDGRSLGRVLIKSLVLQQEESGGGSTLTQQLAKNLYPRKSYVALSLLINKFREMIIASRLENVYEKNELLALYLNTVSFGDNTFGLEAAAMRFFSRPASDLSVDQIAVLIGMLKATYQYNPRVFPKRSLQRRNIVLAQMRRYDLISTQEYDSAIRRPIQLEYRNITHHSGMAPYFRDFIREELMAWCETYNESQSNPVQLFTGGLKIYTTIDSRLQRYAEEAVAQRMAPIQKKFQEQLKSSALLRQNSSLVENAMEKSDHYHSLKATGHSHEEIVKIMQTPVPMTILTIDGEKELIMSPLDSIRHYLRFLHAGFLAMDPRDGAIRAWVGGINHEFFQFDHVRETTKRQVGSTFKPIVYAAALEQGADPCEFISAGQTTYTNMEGWSPKNSSGEYGLKYSMPGALAYSVNTVSVRVLEKAGIEQTRRLAKAMGITSKLEPVPSLALGSAEISMIELVSAYTGFANRGKVVKPFYITAITTHQGELLARYQPDPATIALSSESAQLILHMLRRAVNEGTSSALRHQFGLTNDIAGKTGTTQSNSDGWFIAITPKLVIGSWVGADEPQLHFRSTTLGQGARTALPIVGEFFQLANEDKTLNEVTRARFPALSPALENRISCASFKSGKNFLEKIFGSSKKEKKRDFGKARRKTLGERLFGKRSRSR